MVQTIRVKANGQEFETLAAGDSDKPMILFLHGFPEYAGAWLDVLPSFASSHYAVAPNQRGYSRSSKPVGIEHYRVQHLAKDMLDLATELAPGRRFHLVAHDWGASVGYMMAFMAAPRIASLTVLNGVHPIPFQHALIHDPAQREASQYMRFLRTPEAATILSANNFERVLGMLARGFGGGRWLTDEKKRGYVEAWGQPGAMEAMTTWYKATPLIVAEPGAPVEQDPLASVNRAQVRVRMPHQVIWGMQDKALLPSARAGLADFCDNLTLHEVADADHWIVHQKTADVTRLINDFVLKKAV